MMQTAGPVDGDVCAAGRNPLGGVDGTTSGDSAKLEDTFKCRVIISNKDCAWLEQNDRPA